MFSLLKKTYNELIINQPERIISEYLEDYYYYSSASATSSSIS